MKKTILLIFAVITIIAVKAQNEQYIEKMKENIKLMDSAKTIQQWQEIANNFERFAGIEDKDWLPLYYTAYCNIMIGLNTEKNKEKDIFYDKAMDLVNKSEKLDTNNSEICVLKAFVLQMQISVKPASRGRKLGPESDAWLGKALKLNPDNPRYYMLKAENYYYTPAMFGGSKQKAKEFYLLSYNKFITFKPQSEIAPNWGLERVKEMIAKNE